MKNLKFFLKKFLKYITIGISIMVVLFTFDQMLFDKGLQNGVRIAFGQTDDNYVPVDVSDTTGSSSDSSSPCGPCDSEAFVPVGDVIDLGPIPESPQVPPAQPPVTRDVAPPVVQPPVPPQPPPQPPVIVNPPAVVVPPPQVVVVPSPVPVPTTVPVPTSVPIPPPVIIPPAPAVQAPDINQNLNQVVNQTTQNQINNSNNNSNQNINHNNSSAVVNIGGQGAAPAPVIAPPSVPAVTQPPPIVQPRIVMAAEPVSAPVYSAPIISKQVPVAGTKELPRTGLPAMFWLALTLLPLGVILRRFSRPPAPNFSNPNYIWEEKNFNK